jgi:hypothetical protein
MVAHLQITSPLTRSKEKELLIAYNSVTSQRYSVSRRIEWLEEFRNVLTCFNDLYPAPRERIPDEFL